MPYLFYLPSLLCGLAIGVEDARGRRVRPSWIFAGSLAQLIADIIAAAMANSFFQILQAVLFTALCAGVLALLSAVKAGGVNGTDALAMIPLGLAVGMLGLSAILAWWLAIGVLGLPFIWCWNRCAAGGANGANGRGTARRFDRRGGMPFIPVLVAAAIIAVIVGTML
ncbi:peptidase A24 [Bifidobacterium sp. 64T4]|uniref:peptidase A24 n=1 Tax=Bifidobacterium pongonis TaxID=2834432 RepID=UPI001C58166C|nr:peptidase A24 [Bifidobacterium pongonis]MBW3093978.1 peptidase A24 [Bifidobacterium pongonis]